MHIPNISYLARVIANPGHTHWDAVQCVIRYLKGTKDVKLILVKGGMLTWEELDYQNRSGMQGYSIVTLTGTHRSITM